VKIAASTLEVTRKTIPTARIDEITLGRCRADATTVTGNGGVAALRFALIVRKHKQVVLIDYDRGAVKGLIRILCAKALGRRRKPRRQIYTIVGTDYFRSKVGPGGLHQHIRKVLLTGLGIRADLICCALATVAAAPLQAGIFTVVVHLLFCFARNKVRGKAFTGPLGPICKAQKHTDISDE